MTDEFVRAFTDRTVAKSLIRDFAFGAFQHGETLDSLARMNRQDRQTFLYCTLKLRDNELQCVEDFLMGFAKAANLSPAWILGMEMAESLRQTRDERT